MLSRIAESLFWIGRYLERAEDTFLIRGEMLEAPERRNALAAELARAIALPQTAK